MNIFELAKTKGIEDLELYKAKTTNKSLKTFDDNVESYQISDQDLLSVRGIYNGKMGYVYTEDLDEDNNELLDKLIANAKVVSSPDIEEIFAGSKEYRKIDEEYVKVDTDYDEILAILNTLNKTAKSQDDVIKNVTASYSESYSYTTIENSKGLKLEKKDGYFVIVIQVIGRKDKSNSSSYEYQIKRKFEDLNPEEIAIEAAQTAIADLGAEPCKSDNYPVVLKNSAGNAILTALKGTFYADNVQKNLSPLKGKLGTDIAGGNITLVDDPFLKDGMTISTFDDEGVATKETKIIDGGKLNSYLHNLKTARKDNVESTGNGFKAAIQSKVGTSTTNLYIQKGDLSFDELIKDIDKGVYITSVHGTHAGINSINGDFSLQSQGYMIENGKVTSPLRLITIAGNYFEMLNKVEKISNEIKFDYSGVGTPTMLIKELAVSGK